MVGEIIQAPRQTERAFPLACRYRYTREISWVPACVKPHCATTQYEQT